MVINHPSAESFSSCTYEDARWLVRRLSDLRLQDLQDIVKAGAFPPELEEIVLAKLVSRVKNAFELFSLKSNTGLPNLSLNVSSRSGGKER